MPVLPPTATARQRLKAFELKALFLEDLGWDHCPQALTIVSGGKIFPLTAIAKKCGMVAYACPPPDGETRLPDRSVRLAIDRELTQTTYEHLLIFTDTARTIQIWQWVRREPGKPIACREHKYESTHSGDHLLERLQLLAVSLDEEERGLALPDIAARARAAFDVERVTKRFYDQFRKEKDDFTKLIEGIPVPQDRHWYASVMLNRLMFVYFIQRKGFLDGDHHYLRNRLNRCKQERGKDQFHSFYRHFLLRLFQEGLGQRPPRKAGLDRLLGRIPYLNGGIFDIHTRETEHRYGPKIEIPDEAFENIFDYFDRYDWTLDSTRRPRRPGDKEEINPEILGYIFEKYINQKEMGAYYTQDDITEYISKSTIIPFFFDAARPHCKVAFENPTGPTVWNLLQTNPDRYLYPAVRHGTSWHYIAEHPAKGYPLESPLPLPPEIAAGLDANQPDLIQRRKPWNKTAPPEYGLPTETWREVVARRQHCDRVRAELAGGTVQDINPFVTLNLDLRQFAQDVIETCEGPDLLMAFWHAIASITVLDPTGGSGAFIFAALNVLEPLYEACLDRMQGFLAEWGSPPETAHHASRPQNRPHISRGSPYEIAHPVLSLHERPHNSRSQIRSKTHPIYQKAFTEILERVEKHPNRSYFVRKSIIVNNLYAVDIMEEAVEICKLRLFLTLAAQLEPDPDDHNLGIEPLPDIDFNVRAGNSLVGYATADEVRRFMKTETTRGADQMRLGVMGEKDAYGEFEDELLKVDAAFRSFRQQQTELGGTVTAEDKRDLQKRLAALETKLNGYLAHDYGVRATQAGPYDRWLTSHRPFHWLIDFYAIMSNGGFDVVIGNPPYVSAAKVTKQYTVRNLVTHDCPDIYAWILERAESLLRRGGRSGMIVPLSLGFSGDFAHARSLLRTRYGQNWFSSFGRIPSALFSFDVRVRNTIHLGHKASKQSGAHTTRLHRWFEVARPHLFDTLAYATFNPDLWGGRIPKINTQALSEALENCIRGTHRRTGAAISPTATRHILYFKKTAYNWLNFCREMPPCFEGNRPVEHTQFGNVCFRSSQERDLALLLWDGKLEFVFWAATCDDFHVPNWSFESFPMSLDNLSDVRRQALLSLLPELEAAMAQATQFKLNAGRRVGNYNLAKCRHITDQTDRIFSDAMGLGAVWDDIELYCVQIGKTDFDEE